MFLKEKNVKNINQKLDNFQNGDFKIKDSNTWSQDTVAQW